MYLVSPQLLVTREHIISESDSTSSSFLVGSCVAVLSLREGAGDVTALGGLGSSMFCCGVPLCEGVCPSSCCCIEPPSCDVREEPVPVFAPARFSESRFSSVPKSVRPSSSSERSPDSLSRLSMRPRRFSSPSIYFALQLSVSSCWRTVVQGHSPFGRLALLFHLGEDALGLVVLAVGASGHLAVTFDFLFATHVTRLRRQH